MLDNKLDDTRKDLLDLSARNRLINTRRSSIRSSRLDIIDELADEIFRILVADERKMSFLAKPESNDNPESIDNDDDLLLFTQPDEENEETDDVAARHTDDKLQTKLDSEALQKKLLKISYEARSSEEEQGVNTLYLAIGFLKWTESNRSDVERQAPLILIPVTLTRSSANAKFRLAWDDNDIATNLSLQEKLRSEFGIELPNIDDPEGFSPTEYFAKVQSAISTKPDWELEPDGMVLWFFSFAKFLMYKDLDSDNWPPERSLSENKLISGLLGEGFQSDPPLCGEDQNIDEFLKPIDLVHVVDADSSQTLAIEESKTGRNLVIQGPPGTGKSQTITNIIAAAVNDGRKVLFVAEKMAALQVVQRRLQTVGLGPLCLELHSHKANKKAVLNELESTLELGMPKQGNNKLHANELKACRDKLNQHANEMHTRLMPSMQTPYQIVGELVRLHSQGAIAPEFEFPGADSWTPVVYRQNLGLIKDLTLHLANVGNPTQHIWHGAQVAALLPADHARIQKQIASIRGRLTSLDSANKTIAQAFELGTPNSLIDSVKLANSARLASKAPQDVDNNCLLAPAWKSQLDEIEELISISKECQQNVQTLEPVVASVAWTTELDETRRHLRAYGRSWFRFFNSKFRNAKAELAGILEGSLPRDLEAQLDIVDGVLDVQVARQKIDSQKDLGKQAFGNDWKGEDSNFETLSAIIDWHRQCQQQDLPPRFFEVAANNQTLSKIKQATTTVRSHINELLSEIKDLFERLQLRVSQAFSMDDPRKLPLTELDNKLAKWTGATEELSKWLGFIARLGKLPDAGMEQLKRQIGLGTVNHEALPLQFQACYFERLMRTAYEQFPRLAEFNGESHEQTLYRFRELDLERREFARHQVAAKHYSMLPNRGAQSGEIGIVKREIAKKRRHMPIRKLLVEAGHAIQAIKPVFMLSPISVAQFLAPGVLEFDLLLIDEASQVKPVDALGAMARAKQIIVVGDERQLPPTNFFNKVVTGDDDASDDDGVDVKDMESVLGLCAAQSINQRMLRWHYRSRHHSLIAVSNYEFYDSKLFVIPSPSKVSKALGLSFVHVKGGVFDRGKSRTNRIEATAVAEAVLDHAQTFPDKSLGVAAFSVAQRDAILNEVELRRRNHPELEEFFATGGPEPFFVKNIENVQGDERDTIIISVGYGRDSSGYLPMSFGPLQTDGGERRLNVLISRAKEKCVVFSSITADDIDLNRARSRGVAAFKTFLTYARSGFLDVGIVEPDRGFDSEFERQVAKDLAGMGYEVKSQIGVAGFFIDLAIVDPERPGRYLIGIECDGASYHSSRSARDRDRIRQAVLEDRNWMIHRIWSTDWFQRPDEQLRQVVAAVEKATAEWARRDQALPDCDVDQNEEGNNGTFQLVREKHSDFEVGPSGAVVSVPYREATFSVSSNQEIHELSPDQLGRVVEGVVKVEGPVHTSEIARRIASLWGLSRTGSRITKSVDNAIDYMASRGKINLRGEFVFHPKGEIEIRSREDVQSPGLRKSELLPPTEIEQATIAIVEINLGISAEEVIKETSQLFGFKSTSSKLKATIHTVIQRLIENESIEQRNDRLYPKEQERAIQS